MTGNKDDIINLGFLRLWISMCNGQTVMAFLINLFTYCVADFFLNPDIFPGCYSIIVIVNLTLTFLTRLKVSRILLHQMSGQPKPDQLVRVAQTQEMDNIK